MRKVRYFKIIVGIILTIGGGFGNWATLLAHATEESEVLGETTATEEKEEENEEETPEEVSVKGNVWLLSFNPGYSDTGEFLELKKLSEESISLAGLSVVYINSSLNEYDVYSFGEESEMVGESLLLRLASSSEVKNASDFREVSDAIYTRNMAQGAGQIKLIFDDEEIDSVCWGFSDSSCVTKFNSNKPTTLVREFSEEEIGEFEHVADYTPSYDPEKPGLVIHEKEEEKVEPKCQTVEFSEILTYFETSSTEQFIELFNRGEESVELSECVIKYKNKVYNLSGAIEGNGFRTFYPVSEWGVALTKNPSSSNKLELIDVDGSVVDTLVYTSGQRKGVSFAMVGHNRDGSENWEQTYAVTPNRENVFQEFKTCPIGKVINLETGNCVNETSLVKTQAACPEGKYRNPLTGRCKSYATTASAELKPCAEGYERNPETGRCRKIVKNDGAEYAIEPEVFEERSSFVAIWAIVAVVAAGIVYIIFQYREEIREKLKRKK